MNEIVKKKKCKNVIKHFKIGNFVLYFVINVIKLIKKTINKLVRLS